MRMKLPILLLIQLDRLVTLIIVKTEQFHFLKIALNWLKIIQTLQVASRVIHKKCSAILNESYCMSVIIIFHFFLVTRSHCIPLHSTTAYVWFPTQLYSHTLLYITNTLKSLCFALHTAHQYGFNTD